MHPGVPGGPGPASRACLLVLLAACALAALTSTTAAAEELADRRRTLILLLDGFRWDYIKHLGDETTGFRELVKEGASAEYVRPVFPSLSFPSWTTISTGVYPETHGILANFFYNRQRNQAFKLNDTATTRKAFWWQGQEPLWTTAVHNGLRVATVLWSRSDVQVHGLRLEEAQGYEYQSDALGSLRDSLERSMEYLQRGLDLVMVYSELVDEIGHNYGPDSLEMKYTIGDVGKLLSGMFRQLETRGLRDKVNVIVLGDHGMATVNPDDDPPIKLRDYLNPDDVEQAMGQGAFVSVYAKPGRVEYIYKRLAAVPGLTVWRRGEVPRELHYNRNALLPDIIVSAKKGYMIRGLHSNASSAPRPHGIHGYQPDVEQMRTAFYAIGPDFKRGVQVGPIDLVDEYQVFCHVLRIPAHPHNGTWSRVRGLLVGDPAFPFGDVEEPSAIRSTPGPLLQAPPPAPATQPPAPQGPPAGPPPPPPPPPPPSASVSSGPVRIALSVIAGLVGWYIFLCVITNSHG